MTHGKPARMGGGPGWLVGIGSSAGGVEALREVLPGIADTATYVIAQHMSPVHPSLLLQVLSRETGLTVSEIADGVPLEPRTIYVAPPNCDVEVVDGAFRTRKASPRISPQPSIDVLLASIANEAGSNAISVILSGTGSDGTQGSEAVRNAGGHTIAQDPTTARYRDMPSAAIDAGSVDHVARPQAIGPLIADIVAGHTPDRSGGRFPEDPAMAALAREARRVTGWDLAAYKDGTLGRQLTKRVSALGLPSVDAYVGYVRDNPSELALLRDSMLITVTSFLRDRAAYGVLEQQLEMIATDKPADEPLRAWVAGCATGEEAYSIAMLLAEAIRVSGIDRAAKVFATDISDTAMEFARRGTYPVSALEHVPQEWVERYFTVAGERATVAKRIRDMLVIARQDITRDPPLVRMDLVSCRNLLIYLVPGVQARVLTNLHAALNPGGLLFLGRSESVPPDAELFTTLNAGNRLFRRGPGHSLATYLPAALPRATVVIPSRHVITRVPRDQVRDDVRDQLLDQFGPPSLVLDPSMSPVHQVGAMGRYLTMPTGDGDFSLASMILPALRTEVTTLVSRVNREGQPSATHPVVVHFEDGSTETVVIHARRVTPRASSEPYVLLSFVPAPAPPAPERLDAVGDGPVDSNDAVSLLAQVGALEHELLGTREHLQAVIEELESSNEELQAMNEELQAASEELQATNEELETTNEELQATNEELTTVNETLEVRSAELTDTNTVLRNIQEAVHTAIILLDRHRRVLQFSPLAVKAFGLVKGDIGTPIELLPTRLDIPDLATMVRDVIDGGEGQVLEASTPTSSYLVQLMPYLTEDGPSGAILALSDITELDTALRDARWQRSLVEGIFTRGGTPMAWLGENGEILEANDLLAELLGMEASALAGASVHSLVSAVDSVDVAAAVAAVRAGKSDSARIHARFSTMAGRMAHIDLTIAAVPGEDDDRRAHIATFHDVSAAQEVRERLESEERQLDAVFLGTGAPMAIVSPDGVILRVNRSLCTAFGYVQEELTGRAFSSIAHPDDANVDTALFHSLVAGQRQQYQVDKRYLTKDGRTLWGRLMVSVAPAITAGDSDVCIATILDVTGERERENSALRQAQTDPLTGLANRMLVFDRLRQALLRAQRVGESVTVLFVDLNGFKGINDRLGHDIGDIVITTTADRLTAATREADTVARLGGDEFLVIAPHEAGESVHEGLKLADRILRAVAQPIDVSDPSGPIVVTASIGVAHSPTDGVEVEDLVRKADVAMYSAKQSGANNVSVYSERLTDESRRLSALRAEILRGLENGEFLPYYQPIVDARTLQPLAVEILGRWQHPERGLLPPAEFLELVAAFDQLEPFTRAILESAVRDAEAMARRCPNLTMSLNLDPSQLRSTDVPALVTEAIGSDLAGWTVEITETGYFGDDARVKDALAILKRMGARTALDDFGTGYSSVMHLNSWGFDEVKIDREFVLGLEAAETRTLVGTMVDMAHAFGAATVAEGVETVAQADELRSLHVDRLQGYLFSRPLSGSTILPWLDANGCGGEG